MQHFGLCVFLLCNPSFGKRLSCTVSLKRSTSGWGMPLEGTAENWLRYCCDGSRAKIDEITLNALRTRQSLVKGERLVRHEMRAVLSVRVVAAQIVFPQKWFARRKIVDRSIKNHNKWSSKLEQLISCFQSTRRSLKIASAAEWVCRERELE